jgi:hypothetical protein
MMKEREVLYDLAERQEDLTHPTCLMPCLHLQEYQISALNPGFFKNTTVLT